MGGDFTEWSWEVMPSDSGRQIIHLSVAVRFKIAGAEEEKYHPVIDREIRVRTNALYSVKRFVAASWQWVATAIILPFIPWWLRRRSEKKKKAAEERLLILKP